VTKYLSRVRLLDDNGDTAMAHWVLVQLLVHNESESIYFREKWQCYFGVYFSFF